MGPEDVSEKGTPCQSVDTERVKESLVESLGPICSLHPDGFSKEHSLVSLVVGRLRLSLKSSVFCWSSEAQRMRIALVGPVKRSLRSEVGIVGPAELRVV